MPLSSHGRRWSQFAVRMDSNNDMVHVTKYWLPAVLIAISGITLFGGNVSASVFVSRFLLQVPFALLAIFLLTVVDVRAGENGLSYRRFLRWRQLDHSEVIACGKSSFPTLGYISVKRFVPPWGKLYFVAKATNMSPWFPPSATSDAMTLKRSDRCESQHNNRDERRVRLREGIFLPIVVLAGMLYAEMLSSWFRFVLAAKPWLRLPQLIALPLRFVFIAVSWPWGIITLAFLLAAFLKANLRRDWFLSFMIGALAGLLVLTAFR